jgi:chromosome segregation ATPase
MNDSETHRMLGELQGSLAAIQRQLINNEDKAREARDRVYEALREIRSDAQDTKHRTDSLERIMKEEVRPVVRSVVDWRSRALGGAVVLGAVGTVVLFILTATKDAIVDLWRALIQR